MVSNSLCQIPVLNNGQLDINVRAVDNSGHFFHNFSSMVIEWSNTDNKLVRFYSPNTVYEDLDGEIPGSKHLRGKENNDSDQVFFCALFSISI